MPQYEVVLEIDPVPEDVEDALMSMWDCSFGGHGDVTLLTVTADGATAEGAFRSVVHELDERGVRVRRLVEDLVTRKAIALRAGVTPQAVGLWTRGERQQATPFPAPYALAGGGLWLWGEVAAWLAAAGLLRDDLLYPTRQDHVRCNMWLLDRAPRLTACSTPRRWAG